MSIPLVFFCALLNLALGYELAVRMGYGQASPSLRWARGNVFVIMPAPLRLRLTWLSALRDHWILLRRGQHGSRLPKSTAGALAWYDVTQQWLQKLHADASAADDCLLAQRQNPDSDGAQATASLLRNLVVDQRASLTELEAQWRKWRKGVSVQVAEAATGRFKNVREALKSLAKQTPRKQNKAVDAAQALQLAASLADMAAHSHALRDALWLALAEADDQNAPPAWSVDSLTSLAAPLALKRALETLRSQAGPDSPPAAVAVRLGGLSAINREHGTRVGDRLIRTAALAIRQTAAEATMVARAAGTTFVWLDPRPAMGEVEATADAVRQALAALETEADQELLHIAAQTAVVRCDEDGKMTDLLQRLDAALQASA